MAQPSSLRLLPKWRSLKSSPICNRCLHWRRAMATQAAVPEQPFAELEQESSLVPIQNPDPRAQKFDPLAFSKSRKRQLPPSRYARLRFRIVAVALTNHTTDIDSEVPSTIVVPCTPINHYIPQIPLVENLFLVPSLLLELSWPTTI